MPGDLLFSNLWVALAAVVVLYVADYYLTLLCARRYQTGVRQHLVYETFELTPYYQQDVAHQRRFSGRLLAMVSVVCAALALAWAVRTYLPLTGALQPFYEQFYLAVLGAVLLFQAPVHLRHVQNLVLFRSVAHSQGVEGRIVYSAWLSYQVSAAQLAGFAALFLICALLFGSWFFAGGSFKCGVEAVKHWRLGRKAIEKKAEAAQANETPETSGS